MKMKTLEATIERELVPVVPAKKAFSRVSGYFSTDKDLARVLHERSKVLYPENPINFNTLRTSFTDRRKQVMDKRISDLVFEFDKYLKEYLERKDMEIVRNDLVYDPRFLRYRRNEAPRFCKDIVGMIGPLMDWYQFKSRRKLAKYLSEQTSMEFNVVHNIFAGAKHYVLTPQMVHLRDQMSDMLRRAKESVPGAIPREYVFSRKKDGMPESLNSFTGRALTELLGKDEQCDRRFIEAALDNFKYVRQLMHLLKEVERAYSYRNRKAGFMTRTAMRDFFSHVVDPKERLDSSVFYSVGDGAGRGTPTVMHRKFYVIALMLRDAAQRGIHVNIDGNYLVVRRDAYLRVMNDLIRKGFTPGILEAPLSDALRISKEHANTIVRGGQESINLEWYLSIGEFRDTMLDGIFVLDLTHEKTKNDEFEGFKRTYTGGRVLVKINRTLTSGDKKMLVEICDLTYKKGLPFLYPTPMHNVPEAAGYIHHSGLFRTPDYGKIQEAFLHFRAKK